MRILIKGGQFFENASMVECVLFDKTGTLTNGIMTLKKFKIENNIFNLLEEKHANVTLIEFHKEPGCGIFGLFSQNQQQHEMHIGRISWILENASNNQYFRDNYLEIEG